MAVLLMRVRLLRHGQWRALAAHNIDTFATWAGGHVPRARACNRGDLRVRAVQAAMQMLVFFNNGAHDAPFYPEAHAQSFYARPR